MFAPGLNIVYSIISETCSINVLKTPGVPFPLSDTKRCFVQPLLKSPSGLAEGAMFYDYLIVTDRRKMRDLLNFRRLSEFFMKAIEQRDSELHSGAP